MLTIDCTSCGKQYRVADTMAGKKVRCKNCDAAIRVRELQMASVGSTGSSAAGNASCDLAQAAIVQSATAKPSGVKTTAALVAARATTVKAPPPVPAKRPVPMKVVEPVAVVAIEEPDETEDYSYAEPDVTDLGDLSALEAGGSYVEEPEMTLAAPTRSARKTGTSIHDLRRNAPPTKTRKNKKSGGGLALGFRFNWAVRIALFGGVALLVAGIREVRLSGGASDAPADISCGQLGTNGPGDNNHVQMTGFVALDNIVYMHQKTTGDWTMSWIPMVPVESVKPAVLKQAAAKGHPNIIVGNNVSADTIHVLLKTNQLHAVGDLLPYVNKTSFTGMVMNKVESLTNEEKELFQGEYGGIDLEHCYILEDGREPRSGAGMGMLLAGAAAALGGLFMMFKPE